MNMDVKPLTVNFAIEWQILPFWSYFDCTHFA